MCFAISWFAKPGNGLIDWGVAGAWGLEFGGLSGLSEFVRLPLFGLAGKVKLKRLDQQGSEKKEWHPLGESNSSFQVENLAS